MQNSARKGLLYTALQIILPSSKIFSDEIARKGRMCNAICGQLVCNLPLRVKVSAIAFLTTCSSFHSAMLYLFRCVLSDKKIYASLLSKTRNKLDKIPWITIDTTVIKIYLVRILGITVSNDRNVVFEPNVVASDRRWFEMAQLAAVHFFDHFSLHKPLVNVVVPAI